MLHDTKELMNIGKLTLEIDRYYGQNTLQFKHVEIQQDPFYSNEVVETEITKEDAIELISHLQDYFELNNT